MNPFHLSPTFCHLSNTQNTMFVLFWCQLRFSYDSNYKLIMTKISPRNTILTFKTSLNEFKMNLSFHVDFFFEDVFILERELGGQREHLRPTSS